MCGSEAAVRHSTFPPKSNDFSSRNVHNVSRKRYKRWIDVYLRNSLVLGNLRSYKEPRPTRNSSVGLPALDELE